MCESRCCKVEQRQRWLSSGCEKKDASGGFCCWRLPPSSTLQHHPASSGERLCVLRCLESKR
jgi:hypothetical protein